MLRCPPRLPPGLGVNWPWPGQTPNAADDRLGGARGRPVSWSLSRAFWAPAGATTVVRAQPFLLSTTVDDRLRCPCPGLPRSAGKDVPLVVDVKPRHLLMWPKLSVRARLGPGRSSPGAGTLRCGVSRWKRSWRMSTLGRLPRLAALTVSRRTKPRGMYAGPAQQGSDDGQLGTRWQKRRNRGGWSAGGTG